MNAVEKFWNGGSRGWVLAVYSIVVFASFVGMTKLGVNPNNRVFFGPGDPEFSELTRFEAEFGTNTSLLFGISSEYDLATDPALIASTRWLTQQVWRLDGVTRVDSLSTYPYGVYSEDSLDLTTIAEAFCQNVCSGLTESGFLKPHLVGRFVSRNGKTLSVVASVEVDAEDSVAVSRLNTQAVKLVEEFVARYPNLEIAVTGAVPMMQAFMDASNKDMGSLMVVAVLLFIALLWLFVGGVWMTTLMVVLGISSIVITMGIAGWFGYTVNTATATTPLVIFTLVVAASMHVFLYVARDPCGSNEEVVRAVDKAYSANTIPVILAAITSVVGLLSLVFVEAPPLKELGLLSAGGVLVGTTLLLVVVPCALSFFGRITPSKAQLLVQQFLNRQAKKIEQRKDRPLLFVLLFVGFVAFLPNMNVDEDFVRYFGEENTFRKQSEILTEKLSGPYHAEIVIDTGKSGGIYKAAVVEIVDSLAEYVRADRAVANVLTVNDVLREVAAALDDRKSLSGLDEDTLAQFFLSFELALSKGQSTTDFVDVDHRLVRMSVLFGDVSMADIRLFEDKVHQWADMNLPDDLSVTVTGEGVPTAHLSNNSIRQLAIGIAISLLFSSLLLGVIYRNHRLVVVVLCATTIPVLAGFGIWAAMVGEIGMAATLVVAVTIGVVIDDSIHMLYRYRDGLEHVDLSPLEAAGYTVHRTAVAVFTTSIVLAGGFSVLMMSDFHMNSAFGICSALVILLGLVYNLTLMPRSLVWATGMHVRAVE